jgi:histidyl-tRNA synthetase
MEGQNAWPGEMPHTDIYVVTATPEAATEAAVLAHDLRKAGLSADMDFTSRSMKAQMKYASQIGARFVCILGDDEIASGTAGIKNMATGEQVSVSRADAAARLVSALAGDER